MPADVPPGPLLVDSDVASYLLLGQPEAAEWRPLLRDHGLLVSFATVGELLALPAAARWGARRTADWTQAIRSTFATVPFSVGVTEVWAALHNKYKGHLHRGGTNDLWTAATALHFDPPLPLATNNLRDFQHVAADHRLHLIHPSC